MQHFFSGMQVDMGWTAQGGGQGQDAGYGSFTNIVGMDRPANGGPASNLKLVGLKQEMSEVSTVDGSPLDFSEFPIGSIIAFAPYHSCASGHCHSKLLVMEDGQISGELHVVRGW